MKVSVRTVVYEDGRLFIIDQRLLPREEKIIELKSAQDVATAIRSLAVRGAPAIGIAAAYGVVVALRARLISDPAELAREAFSVIERIASTRPTAYNLFYALGRMRQIAERMLPADETLRLLEEEAVRIHREDLERSERIAAAGAAIVPATARILTHCNAGGLATGGNGTALAVITRAYADGKNISVVADETRPLLQGARLTAWEMSRAGIPCRVITDGMAGFLMARGDVDLVITGADRIAANGDFANKIGTYALAVLAKHHGIPFYAAAPVSTFDFGCASGRDIPVEERDPEEVLSCAGVRTAPEGVTAWNPAFDITPGGLVTGFITEDGVLRPPYGDAIARYGAAEAR